MKLLLLAGTAEARDLATRLADAPDIEALASLAGETQWPERLAVPLRVGGFGGMAEQEKYIKENSFTAIIDATHPFAARISQRTQAICARLNLPYLQLLRPGWEPGPGDDWQFVENEAAVAELVPAGATVFLATGRKTLDRFAGLAGRRLFCRRIDPAEAPFPFPGGDYVVGRPPFSVTDEVALFRKLGIDVLVVKDAGGSAQAKLIAARELGLQVIVIRRPAQPPGDKVATVAAALAWLERRL